jgi:hypothetical protein
MDNDTSGPVDYLVEEFPDGQLAAGGFTLLLDLVDRGAVRILDLEVVSKDADGRVRSVDLASLDQAVLAPFVGASAGLLDAADLGVLAEQMSAGSLAVVIVYEDLAMVPVLDAWAASGARPLAAGQLTEADIVAALDGTDGA